MLALALGAPGAIAQSAQGRQFAQDFDAMWRAVDEGYAYFDGNRSAWRRARETWRPRAARAATRAQFVSALEGALATLHDDHASLSESIPDSPRQVPCGTDIWAAWKDGAAVVEAVRTYSDADVAGVHPGHSITMISGIGVDRAVRDLLGKSAADTGARDWALRRALAGRHAGARRVTVAQASGLRTLDIEPRAASTANAPPVIGRRIGEDRDLGYVRIRSASLADPGFAGQFDAALDFLKDTRALILDLREVCDPAPQDVLRAILGRFATAAAPWRQREPRGAARVVDAVAPRGTPYRAPLVVLVDRWTAGDGEALAAGLQAVAKARLVGTAMAGMRGEVREARLPHSGIVVRFPAEKSFTADGTPREQVRPTLVIDLAAPQGGPGDPILYQALKLLERK